MIIQPKVRGFICTSAHPIGCKVNVSRQIDYVMAAGKLAGPKNVLIIGGSTGYGLASSIVAGFGCNAKTVRIFYEKPPSDKRTGTAGWYNTIAFDNYAKSYGLYTKGINGDAFSIAAKAEAAKVIAADLGQVDLVIYSLASPRRVDPATGVIYNSVLKPIGSSYSNKTLDVLSGKISDITLEPASPEEANDTVKVMGGEDWELWIDYLLQHNLLAPGAKTVAYSYIGPELTAPIYRKGTIGTAKEHLEATAKALDAKLQMQCEGRAFVSINKALVTQASSAIPVVPLYLSLLYKLMKANGTHEGCIEQIYRLFKDRLFTNSDIALDIDGRIRVDELELAAPVQAEIQALWGKITTENIYELTDLIGYREEFYQLFGFEVDGVDYNKPVEIMLQSENLVALTA